MGRHQPSTRTIVGVGVLLFGAVIFGVGLHHMVATGTCSSTGYSSNYGPVPYCPKGTGTWFAFLFGGIFMVVIGGFVSGASSVVLIVPTVFSAIGIGSLTVAFDSHVASGSKTFGLIFGGVFAAIGLIPALVIGGGALMRMARGGRAGPPRGGTSAGARFAPTTPLGATLVTNPLGASAPGLGTAAAAASSGLGTSSAASAFGAPSSHPDPILGAYVPSPPGTGPTLRPPQGSAPTPPGGDVLDKISKLSDLHKSGALTDDEFNREKAKLLAQL